MRQQMAAYCRLSKDDGESRVSGSIENQLKIIREYVDKSDDLEIADTYIDDGFSGMHFDGRPQFKRMMEDIHKGKIQGVITKDISRLGREHIETSNYIERIFPTLNVRYIAILDALDTNSHCNEELAQFKTLFNDMYCRDISKKIRSSLEIQKKRGNFMSGFAPYGYIKNPVNKHHFLVDEEAARVVKRIFSMYLAGYSKASIAKRFNEEGILTPSEYKRKVQGQNYANGREKPGASGWAYPTLNIILRNRVYIGDMVQHKAEKVSYKVDKYRYIPADKQIIVKNTHEAIIDKDTFWQTQRMMKKRTRTPGAISGNTTVNPFAGILVCQACGYNLMRVARRDGYECATYHSKGSTLCKSHFISRKLLEDVLRHEMERQVGLALKEDDKADIIKAAMWGNASVKEAQVSRKLDLLQQKQIDIQRYKRKIYEDYVDGILEQKEYITYKNHYEQQNREIYTQIKEKESEKESLGSLETNRESWIVKLVKNGTLNEVPREAAAGLIGRIVVNGDKSLDIEFRYQSPYV